jgi:hypothetical protein
MDRRKSIKTIALGTVSAGVALEACKLADKKTNAEAKKDEGTKAGNLDRQPEEKARDEKVMADKFFTEQELATILSGRHHHSCRRKIRKCYRCKGARLHGFIVKDIPQHQVP